MKFINMKGIQKIEKKMQASIRGGDCCVTVGGETYWCTTYNIEIHLESMEAGTADTLTKHVSG